MTVARELMQKDVLAVSPTLSVSDLEQRFVQDRVGGYPVVDGDRLVGVVSRTDVIRRLCVERSIAGYTSDYYHFATAYADLPEVGFGDTVERMGRRMEDLHVEDVMVRHLVTVRPEHTLRHVARAIVDNGVHRVLVTEHDRLVGVLSATDIVRWVADAKISDD